MGKAHPRTIFCNCWTDVSTTIRSISLVMSCYIPPNCSLSLGLGSEPRWPLVSNKFVSESEFLCHFWNQVLRTYAWLASCTSWKHICHGIIPTLTLNLGDKKFSMNQNLTVLSVCSRTERIIMDKKRSYKWPEATEKMLISACTVSLTLFFSLDLLLKILW